MEQKEWKAEMRKRLASEIARLKRNDMANPRRPKCWHCGKPLPRYQARVLGEERQWGRNGDNHFCGIGCGYRYALELARAWTIAF